MTWLILLHAGCCLFMTGVIWVVQLLVYPNFRFFSASAFAPFHRFHSTRITMVVGPVMVAELVTALLLFQRSLTAPYLWNFGSVFLIWILTVAVSIPQHRRLELNPGSPKDWLIWSNWPRTLIWSGRSLCWGIAFHRMGIHAA
jgi:hypothetical protein